MKVKQIPFKYAKLSRTLFLTDEQVRQGNLAKTGSVFGGTGIPKSKLRKMSATLRFNQINTSVRKAGINSLTRSDREFYSNRI